jgi:hypothetical protein
MRTTVFLAMLLAACGGGNKHNNGDDDGGPDGSMNGSADAPPPNCDFTEAADGTNDKTTEMTNLSIGGDIKTICGSVQGGHFDNGLKVVDIDTYRVTVTGSDLLIRFYGGQGVEAISEFSALVFDTAANPTLVAGGSMNPALDHGVYFTSLTPGTYDIVITAKNTADISGFDYKVRVSADPSTRCNAPMATGATVAYHEAGEAAGNDVVAVTFAKPTQFAMTTGTPEPTALTIDPLKQYWVQGSSDNTNAPDDYMDRDTYEITTGADTNEIGVRLNWTASGPDLDFLTFEATKMNDMGDGLTTSPTAGEYQTIAVKPGTKYWVWVGSHDGSTGLPAMYDLSLCGSHFVPDQAR